MTELMPGWHAALMNLQLSCPHSDSASPKSCRAG